MKEQKYIRKIYFEKWFLNTVKEKIAENQLNWLPHTKILKFC